MDRRSKLKSLWIIAVALTLAGCGWWGADEAEVVEDDLFPTLDDVSEFSDESAMVVTEAPTPATGELKLQLRVGDRFPLLKTVEQQLFQPSVAGMDPSRSRLELLMAVMVEEVHTDRTRLTVHYQRVRYSHNIAGDVINYDSRFVADTLPAAARVYHGLASNSLSFWIGPDNRIVEIVGLEEFLQRCLRDVPHAERDAMMARLSALQGEQGIANFVDDSIGLLPYAAGASKASAVSVGDTWRRTTQLTDPMPMTAQTDYTLTDLNDLAARIDVSGKVIPLTAANPSQTNLQMSLRQGHCFGNCTIDRATGLPIESRVERYLDMTVRLASGDTLDQRKKIITTIRAFPSHGEAEMISGQQPSVSRDSGVVTAHATTTAPAVQSGNPHAMQQIGGDLPPGASTGNGIQRASWQDTGGQSGAMVNQRETYEAHAAQEARALQSTHEPMNRTYQSPAPVQSGLGQPTGAGPHGSNYGAGWRQ